MALKIEQYVFLDVVEKQKIIVEELIKIVKKAISNHFSFFDYPPLLHGENNPVYYLPAGDSICIVLLEPKEDDKHIKIALTILELLFGFNEKSENKFFIRIGINENKDIIYNDINGRTNFAGRGINYSQRIMNIALGGQIMVGFSVYDKLVGWDKYQNNFIKCEEEIKHGEKIIVYQYVDYSLKYLNNPPRGDPPMPKGPSKIRN